MKVILFCLSVFFLLGVVKGVEWTKCVNKTYDYDVTEFSFTPDPPVRGQNVTVDAAGTLHKEFTAGKWVSRVFLGIILVQRFEGDLCELAPDCPCPCKPKPNLKIKLAIPVRSDAPSGGYTGDVKSTDQDGNEGVCLRFSFRI